MKCLAIVAAAVTLVVVSASAGYWLGFRHAWGMGVMVEAAPRGVIAMSHTRRLDSQRLRELRYQFEADVDSALVWWREVDQSPLKPALNFLSGTDVIPDYEDYVRRLAQYRKTHASLFDDEDLHKKMIEDVKKSDPAFAEELIEGGRQRRLAMEEMIRKYGQ